MIQRGKGRSSDKISAASMLKKLKEKIPDRGYILPFESTIKNYISYKLQPNRNGSTGKGGRCRAYFVLTDNATEFLKRNMHGKINDKAKDLATRAIKEFEDLYLEIMNLDNAKKFCSKNSASKSKIKSDAKKSILHFYINQYLQMNSLLLARLLLSSSRLAFCT